MGAIYEDPGVLAEYLLFHYGSTDEILPPDVGWPAGMVDSLGFAVRTPSRFSDSRVARGLDLGCAVGRSAFEMTRHCDEVLGIDYSRSFVAAANRLRSGESLQYVRLEEAHRKTVLSAAIPEGVDPGRVSFLQGDAMRLPLDIGTFDRVHAANLICRLTDPQLLLDRLPDLVNGGGELVLATPCTWLEGFTAPKKWPAGNTLDWLKDQLGRSFELTDCSDEPFLIRETARKFQWTRSMLTVWSRRPEGE